MDTPMVSATEKRCRLRQLGVNIGSLPCGPNNAITDAGVLVGHTTVSFGSGPLIAGKGPARTGVTVIKPHAGDLWQQRVSAGAFVLNGNGCVTSLDWVKEAGLLEGPIALTNTHSVGDVYSALIAWMIRDNKEIGVSDSSYTPVVGECDDSYLNDLQGFHVKREHVFAALDTASGGTVQEGAVGAGTGMTCYRFKGGIGTSSRVVTIGQKQYTVGVLSNCNHGQRNQLMISGVKVGEILSAAAESVKAGEGSIVIVVATDAPLSSRQLNRLAKRAALGLGRTGATANHSSGDFVIAFSNGRQVPRTSKSSILSLKQLVDEEINPLFQAAVEATEESILNALCMADTTVGRDDHVVPALPLHRVRNILSKQLI